MEHLLFLGDLFYDYEEVADDIVAMSRWIKKNDFATIINMEGAIKSMVGTPIKKRGPNLASTQKIVEVLKLLNVKGVCLSNNHTMDFGPEALEMTLQILRDNNILYCGAGSSIEEALVPMRFELNGEKISILNFGWDVEETVYATYDKAGCAPRVDEIILNAAKKEVDCGREAIVCLHWGFEYNRLPMPLDIELAHKLIDIGVERIIGHHPHCVQPKEKYKEKYIYYSLGNFYFSGQRASFKKKFHERIANQSDYGVLVSYPETQNNEYTVEYSHNEDKSRIIQENLVLEDISEVDYRSRAYYRQANKRKMNHNPILTLNHNINKVKLDLLFGLYATKRIVKKILIRNKR